MKAELDAIGVIHSPFKEKFAIPRQPGIIDQARGQVELFAPYNDINCFRGIEQFSHLWLIFQFHQHTQQGWRPLVRPPRLGGNKKLGVFATRSSFRPNALGMSVVKLIAVQNHQSSVQLEVQGIDLVDGTPIFDIKPYIPYADALTQASGGFAATAPQADMPVQFSPLAQQQLTQCQRQFPELALLITQLLGQDPRPAYKHKQTDDKEYGVRLHQFNLRWKVENGVNQVIAIDAAD